MRRAKAPPRLVDATSQTELGVWVALGGRVDTLPQVAKQDHQWQFEAEQARQEVRSLRRFVLGMWDRLLSNGLGLWRTTTRVGRKRAEARVRMVKVAKMAKMAGKWQSSWVFKEWKQALVTGKRDRSVVAVVAREARRRVEEGVQVAGLVKLVRGKWQSLWAIRLWEQAMVAEKRDMSVVAVVAGQQGRAVLSGI